MPYNGPTNWLLSVVKLQLVFVVIMYEENMQRKTRGKQIKDWWSRRPFSGFHTTYSWVSDKFWKKQTAKIERQRDKKEIANQLNEY